MRDEWESPDNLTDLTFGEIVVTLIVAYTILRWLAPYMML